MPNPQGYEEGVRVVRNSDGAKGTITDCGFVVWGYDHLLSVQWDTQPNHTHVRLDQITLLASSGPPEVESPYRRIDWSKISPTRA